MDIDLNSFNALVPFVYSKIIFLPKLYNPLSKVCVGIVVYSPDTGEYLYRRNVNRSSAIVFADSMHIDILNDFFTDFPTLEYIYRPEAGTGLDKYPNWLAAVSGELKGIIRVTEPMDGASISLADALDDIFNVEILSRQVEVEDDRVDLTKDFSEDNKEDQDDEKDE